MKTKQSKNALTRVRKYFPHVERVRDSKRSILIRVKPEDSVKGNRKDPASCALARACVRELIADSAIIGIGNSWLIRGKVATRYKTSVGVGREITSFDRHQDFAPGKDYILSKINPTQRLGVKKTKGRGPHLKHKPMTDTIHHTANIRVLKHV